LCLSKGWDFHVDAFALGASRLDDLGCLGSGHLCEAIELLSCFVLEVCQCLGLYLVSKVKSQNDMILNTKVGLKLWTSSFED
jgi:hypothetical protein